MKKLIWIGLTIGGTIGGWLGALPSHGNWLSPLSIIVSGIGSILGIWAAYKIGQNYL